MTTALVIILMPHPWASVAAMAGSFDDESEDEDIGSAVAIARRSEHREADERRRCGRLALSEGGHGHHQQRQPCESGYIYILSGLPYFYWTAWPTNALENTPLISFRICMARYPFHIW